MRRLIVALVLLMLVGAAPAMAIPDLQVYIEGATYDTDSETWLTMAANFRLWIVGNFNEGQQIQDVRVSFAFAASEMAEGPFSQITLTPTTGSYGGVTDDYAPGTPGGLLVGIGASPADLDNDGDLDLTPVMSDGGNISNHGIFGENTNWAQWQLGDMVRWNETLIGDFQYAFPTLGPQMGEIFAYDVAVTGLGSGVHVDAFNHVEPSPGHQGSIFAPYSHDGGGYEVPEPSSLLLLGGALVGYFGWSLKRRKR